MRAEARSALVGPAGGPGGHLDEGTTRTRRQRSLVPGRIGAVAGMGHGRGFQLLAKVGLRLHLPQS